MFSLILGLGNIGQQYTGTRHNLGFEVVNLVAKKLGATSMRERPFCRAAAVLINDSDSLETELILAWPTMLMNRSGLAAGDLLGELELDPLQMLVVVDDFNLSLGALRFRTSGSDGGHNGLASIIETLGTEDFPRLRLGIGPLADNKEVTDFVLSRFTENELTTAERMVALAAEAVIFAANHRLDEAMSKFNSNPALPDEK